MTTEQHTHQGWYDSLLEKAKIGQLTLTEDMAFTLHCIQNHLSGVKSEQVLARDAQEHTEGMIGAMDVALEQVAQRAGIHYPSSGKVRAALDAQRDAERKRLAAERETNDDRPMLESNSGRNGSNA